MADPLDQKIQDQMPDYLKAAAQKNLAAQDSAISAFNTEAAPTAVKQGSALPGVGAPGSTPATDQTNLSMADSMDAADQFNGAQPSGGFNPTPTADVLRANMSVPDMISQTIEARRQLLANAIANHQDPDAPALTPDRIGRHGITRQQEILHEFATINDAAHQIAISKAAQAHQDFTQGRNIDTANDVAGFFHDMASTEHPIGTEEHAKEVEAIAAKHPLAMSTVGARQELLKHAMIHDSAVKFYPTAQAATLENPGSTVEQDPRGRGWRVLRARDATAKPTSPAEVRSYKDDYGVRPDQFAKRADVVETSDLADTEEKAKNLGKVGGGFVSFTVPENGKMVRKTMTRDKFIAAGGTLRQPETKNAPTGTTATIGATPAATTPPVTGTTRTVNGANYTWDGKGWKRAQ